MIKNLIYLDEQKMYSLSSQLFEGITEYILAERKNSQSNSESQRGPVGSGKILADVINIDTNYAEKKSLYDYAYSLFEEHLLNDKKIQILEVDKSTTNVNEDKLKEYSFIKVTAKATFYDVEQITKLIENFNDLGKAFTYLQNRSSFHIDNNIIENPQKSSKGFATKVNRQEMELLKIAQKEGLYLDEKFLDSILFLIKQGFQNNLEIHQKVNKLLYSAPLKRECLREKEEMIIRKYSRKTEKELIVLGLITQISQETIDLSPLHNESLSNMKEVVINVVEHLTNIEQEFSGKTKNEVTIDPIAVYSEL
ncbi:conserved hypothetical protein [Rippkaea orientalis PCC 8801]|uniref:Uncharacterized protein n=1 Tax=Rippkaea orientalis (strain PCC 8801 / RF-1) TaxID=41431 RepID=B7K1F6_RIPO1|nr:hypothetical protein [Rippkaea orientalis]ACK67498.1 conserved hypothetical protein [Rippkaea orientalis PCC 8801]